jgi:hypothetical protein
MDSTVEPAPHLTGRCNCGAVQYEITAPLVSAGYCHCKRCQRRSGAGATANAVAQHGSVHILEGDSALVAWDPGDGTFLKEFCGVCGSHLFARNPHDPFDRKVRLGPLDGDPGVRPARHSFAAYAPVWEPIADDGLPRFDERPPA